MQYDQTADLPEYEDDEKQQETVKTTKGEVRKGNYSGLHSSGFKDFVLKAELMHAIQDCGFEHPSEVQQEALPQAILGTDIICQAKSGMGKTAVFVLALLQQLTVPAEPCAVIVLGHTRELAFQIKNDFERFYRYIKGIKADVFYGGVPISGDIKRLTDAPTPIVVGTPGRLLALAKRQKLSIGNVKYFVMDECDKMLEQVDMRADVQAIFKLTPREKQVMMFSATMNKEIRTVCRKFVQNQVEIFIDDDTKLTLHGLQQYYVKLAEAEKNRKLVELLDALQFNQVVIFVKSIPRANELNKILIEAGFPSTAIHSGLSQDERIARYKSFKEFNKRIMVATDLLGRGIDIERVNIVFNYDMPTATVTEEATNSLTASNTYLHRVSSTQVGRAGRFGTKGLAISMVSSPEDSQSLNEIQERFEIAINELPASIDVSSYSISYAVTV